MEPAAAWDALVEQGGGNEGKAKGFAEMQAKRAEKAVKDAEKIKLPDTDDFDEYSRAEDARQAAIAEAQRQLEHWKAVAGEGERRAAETKAAEEAKAEDARQAEAAKAEQPMAEAATEQAEPEQETPTLMDVVRTLYTKGKEVASKLFQMKFFDVAKTPEFMKQLGLTGDKFTIRYGVIARHLGKDGSHDISETIWEQLPDALQKPFAITKLTDERGNDDGFRLYTTLQNEKGEYIVVGVDVKNAGKELEVNAISTVFGRRSDASLTQREAVIHKDKNITPEQESLLNRPSPDQYPSAGESERKGTENSADVQEAEAEKGAQAALTAETQPAEEAARPATEAKAEEPRDKDAVPAGKASLGEAAAGGVSSVMRRLAERLGLEVVEHDDVEDGGVNGWYADGKIHLNRRRASSMTDDQVGGHEYKHALDELTAGMEPAVRAKVDEVLRQEAVEFMGGQEAYDATIAKRQQRYADFYRSQGRSEEWIAKATSRERMEEELLCDAFGRVVSDPEAARRLVETLETPAQKATMWSRIVDYLQRAYASLAQMMGGGADSAAQDRLKAIADYIRQAEAAKEQAMHESLKREGAYEDTENGQAMYSLRSYEESGREKLRGFVEKRVKAGALSEEDGKALVDETERIYSVCRAYEDKYAPFGAWSEAAVVTDAKGKPVFSVVKANGEYKMNLDFSLVCKKRRTLDAVFEEMIRRGVIGDYELGQVDIAKVNDVIRRHGFETACRLCFVDAKRFRVADVADTFCEMWNELVDMSDDQLRDVIKEEGKMTVRAKAAKHLLAKAGDRVMLSRDNFMTAAGFDGMKVDRDAIMKLYNSKKGTGGPKASSGDVQYLNEIADSKWTPAAAYAVGGVRIQSFSDYVPRMVFDYVQMIAELAGKGLPAHSYTKEPIYAKQFGKTGIKINLSLVPRVEKDGVAPGLDRDGNYVWQEGESFPFEEAVAIQNAEGYRENCGTIAVGVSDAHISKMLDDPDIRMVIPYHKSGLNQAVAVHNNIDAFHDYTDEQNTRTSGDNGLRKLTKAEAKGEPNFNVECRRLGDPRKAAQAYLDWCKERGYTPKFDKWADHPNYYKLLEDFTTMVPGAEGEMHVPHREVRLEFPKEGDAFGSMTELIKAGLEEDAVLEGRRQSDIGNIVDDVERELQGGVPRMSLGEERESAEAQTAAEERRKDFAERQRRAVAEHGTVAAGLAEKDVRVVDVPRHDFSGTGKQAIEKARAWANANLVGEHIANRGTEDEFTYTITEDAVGKYLSGSSTKESDNLGLHLAVLKSLLKVIDSSIMAETHPDYIKDGKRSSDNGIGDDGMLVHRMYGAVTVDGELYRVKTTIKETKSGDARTPYNYQVTKLELLISGSEASDALSNSKGDVISGAKLLQNVEKSYDPGKKLLDESARLSLGKAEERVRFRPVEDAEELKRLESLGEDELVHVYRNVQVLPDGTMASPMAAYNVETGEVRRLDPMRWNGPEERSIVLSAEQEAQLAELNKSGKRGDVLTISSELQFVKPANGDAKLQFHLKRDGQDVWADYNPYDHAIKVMLNDQFKAAWKRPNLVVVEAVIPKSELQGEYQAEFAALPVGEHQWNNGRSLYLSRWSKIVRVVPFKEVAADIHKYWQENPEAYAESKKAHDYDRFQPQVRQELEALGYSFEDAGGREQMSDTQRNLAYESENARYITDRDIEEMNANMEPQWAQTPEAESAERRGMPDVERWKRERVEEIGGKLGQKVRVVTDINEITDENAAMQARKRASKGWYDPQTGELVVVIPNHGNVADVENTVVHELVGHKGLELLVGKERMPQFVEDVYGSVTKTVKVNVDSMEQTLYDKDVERMAAANGGDVMARAEAVVEAEQRRKSGAYRREAMEEYMANLAGKVGELGFEKMSEEELTVWGKVKAKVQAMLDKFLASLGISKRVTLSDRDLQYIMYRSWKGLKERGPIAQAEDVVMRRRTGWDADAQRVEKQRQAVERTNSRFNAELDEQIAGTQAEGHIYQIGMPGDVLLAAGFPEMPIEMAAKQLAKKATQRNHEFSLGDVKNLPSEIQNPIAVFEYGKEGDAENVIVGLTKDGKQFVVGVHFNMGYRGVEVSDIRGLFPKENAEWLNWISQGKAKWLDKERIQALIDQQRTNLAEVEYLDLDATAKIVQNFENPKFDAEIRTRFRDGDMGLDEVITKMKVDAAQANADDLKAKDDAMRAIGGNLSKLRQAMARQKEYDISTAKSVKDLARTLMDAGLLDTQSNGEVKSLLAAMNDAIGKKDISILDESGIFVACAEKIHIS